MSKPEAPFLRTLLIMRHAKSSWDNPAWNDHERPLNDRGLRDAPRMGRLLAERGLSPALIISSTAMRARETAERLAQECDYSSEIQYEPRLYHAAVGDWKEVLRELPDEHRCVLCVGHNPGLEQLIRKWTGEPVEMPTAAIAVVDAHLSEWREYDRRKISVSEIIRPRELDDSGEE